MTYQHDFWMTAKGMAPVEGTDPTAGVRQYDITLQREGQEDMQVAQLFTPTAETFDPTEAVEFQLIDDIGGEIRRLRVGDVLVMKVSVCQ